MNSNDFNDEFTSMPTLESLDGTEKINPSEERASLLQPEEPETINRHTPPRQNSFEQPMYARPQRSEFNPDFGSGRMSGETPYGSGSYNSPSAPQTNFFDLAYNEEEIQLAEKGEKIVKVISIIVIVLSLLGLVLSFRLTALGGAALRIVGALKFKDGHGGWRIYIGVVTAISAVLYFIVAAGIGDMFYASAAVGIVQFIYFLFGLGFAFMTYLIFLSKSVQTYFKRSN